MKWVLQNNLGDRIGTLDKLKSFMEVLKIPFEEIRVVPFSDDPPEVSKDIPTIFYGSTTLIKNVSRSGHWSPGVWFNSEQYEFKNVLAGYGKDNLLNGDSEIKTISEFLDSDSYGEELLFVRPAADFKEFAGGLFTQKQLAEQWKFLDQSYSSLTKATKIQIAAPKNIASEYRTIIVDKKVIASSLYKENDRVKMDSGVPESIIHYANEMAKLYEPNKVFTMDICVLTNGAMKIVELNTFNCSGFYYCDHYEIVKQVTEFAKQML